MGMTERFFKTLRDVLVLTDEIKRLNVQNEKLGDKITTLDRRLVRIETLAELSIQQRHVSHFHE